MAELITIKNRRHGKEYTVTAEEWEAMNKKGHGSKVFEVTDRKDISPKPAPIKAIQTPPEVEEVVAKKRKTGATGAPKTSV